LLCVTVCSVLLGFRLFIIIKPNIQRYTVPSYTEDQYKFFEQLFNRSQYRIKENPAIIPDEVVFSYAAGAYMRGVDPIYINSEHTPLGKYIIGLGIFLIKNDAITIPLCAILTLFAMFLIGNIVLNNKILSLLAVIGFSYEKLFSDQFLVTPLLDMVQLPFILFSLYAFMKEEKKGMFVWTALLVGLVAATKTVVPAVMLVGIFILYLLLQKKIGTIVQMLLFLPISIVVFLFSYIKTFIDGYSIYEFLGFQKWIFLYQKSKLLFPFSVWRLLYRNEWQTWWGDMGFLRADDWQWTWPVITTLPFVGTIFYIVKKCFFTDFKGLLILYILTWELFLSTGVVSSRFFLPLFPICYIISIDIIFQCVRVFGRFREKRIAKTLR